MLKTIKSGKGSVKLKSSDKTAEEKAKRAEEKAKKAKANAKTDEEKVRQNTAIPECLVSAKYSVTGNRYPATAVVRYRQVSSGEAPCGAPAVFFVFLGSCLEGKYAREEGGKTRREHCL